MFKIGQKVSHFMTTHKVGTIINIEYEKGIFFVVIPAPKNFEALLCHSNPPLVKE